MGQVAPLTHLLIWTSDFYYLINKSDGIKLTYIEAHLAGFQKQKARH